MLAERRIVRCSGPPFRGFLKVPMRGLAFLGLILQSDFVFPSQADALKLELARPDDTYSLGMNVELVPHILGSNRRPTGQRGLLAVWWNNSKVLVDNAFRVLYGTQA